MSMIYLFICYYFENLAMTVYERDKNTGYIT